MALDINALPLKKKFNRRLITEDTWIINPFDPGIATPRPYVVEGADYAALFDTTYTPLPLREYVEQYITDKPLKVICTHSHLDHTNDNYLYQDCEIYMSAYAWEEIQERRKKEPAEGMWTQVTAEGESVLMTKEQYGTYTPIILKEGDTIDLGGGHVLEVLPYVGCHSPGSLVFIDHKTGVLFTGDELETGQMLVMGAPGTKSCVEQLRENVVNLINGWGKEIKYICPPHNGSPLHPLFLTHLVENCDRILSGIDGDMDIRSMSFAADLDSMHGMARKWVEDPNILRSEWKGTSIVYNKTRLHKADIEEK